ncbi:MAG TPA: ribosomal protein L7/L12 [Xanthobacteraceae bacterium]
MRAISGPEIGSAMVLILIIICLGVIAIRAAAENQMRNSVLWRIEGKLDLLLQHAGMEFDPFKSLPREVAEAMQRGEKIKAIKLYREATGVGLKEAKDFVEEAQRRAGT